jgi:hypothetical protein
MKTYAIAFLFLFLSGCCSSLAYRLPLARYALCSFLSGAMAFGLADVESSRALGFASIVHVSIAWHYLVFALAFLLVANELVKRDERAVRLALVLRSCSTALAFLASVWGTFSLFSLESARSVLENALMIFSLSTLFFFIAARHDIAKLASTAWKISLVLLLIVAASAMESGLFVKAWR